MYEREREGEREAGSFILINKDFLILWAPGIQGLTEKTKAQACLRAAHSLKMMIKQ